MDNILLWIREFIISSDNFSEDIDLAISHSFFGIEKTSKNQREKLRKTARAYIHEVLSTQLDA